MTARIIDGAAAAAALRLAVAGEAAAFAAAHGRALGLAVVRVGDDPASAVYVRTKARRAAEAGIASVEHRLAATTPQGELMALVARLNADPSVDGILVQLPLPAGLDAGAVIEAIDPAKDVDGLTTASAGRLAAGRPGLVPCTPLGCARMLDAALGPGGLAGAEAVVLGRSVLVGRPMAGLLLARDATVTIAHSRTRDLAAVCRRADVLVAAVGRPGLVRGDWIKPGAAVIDVGINRVAAPELGEGRTRLVGDVAFDEALAVAGHLTPVPGGVGPMTVACLLANTLQAARAREAAPAA